mgnify:CR=1 FL=1
MIYLDNASTTRPCEEAVQAAEEIMREDFFNPSALYSAGARVRGRIESARETVAGKLGAAANEVVFTSGATEANNWAVNCGYKNRKGNAVVSLVEHPSVYETAVALKNKGLDVRFVRPGADGCVHADDLARVADEKTAFVSILHVSNETGAVNDIAAVAKRVKQTNPRTVFLSDGVQAFGKLPVRLTRDIDFYSVSAHKIGGVRGVAGLFRKKGARLSPYIFGGGQENGLRSGTENTFAIKQFEFAAKKKFSSLKEDFERIRSYNLAVRQGLDKTIFRVLSSENASPYILSVSARGLRGEVLLHMLDDAGVMVGTGSACSSKNRYSRVILACGLDERPADGVLRISFAATTTLQETEQAIGIINSCAAALAERTK